MNKDKATLRWTSLLTVLVLLTSPLLHTLFLRDAALGVHIDGSTLDAVLPPVASLRYRLLIRQATAGDRAAVKKLVDFDCGGAAGCYDHGEVLVDVMRIMGDRSFSTAAGSLDVEERQALHSLILAGIEYGRKEVNGIDMRADFALTAAVLGF
jgi:hypothetical protein